MSKSKTPLIVLVLVLLIGLGVGGYSLAKSMGIASRAAEESKAEESERKECEARLALFYQAWKKYKADNHGAAPPTIQAMIPKYIPDVSVLMCPTAVRLDKMKVHMDRGTFELNKQTVEETYGFKWMTPGFPHLAKKPGGDKIPIVICTTHQQAMYVVAYKKAPRAATFDDEERAKLIPEVANAPILGVRADGTVGSLDLSKDR